MSAAVGYSPVARGARGCGQCRRCCYLYDTETVLIAGCGPFQLLAGFYTCSIFIGQESSYMTGQLQIFNRQKKKMLYN
jgi:hypothetical protein